MMSGSKRRRLAGIVAVAALTAACATSGQASPPAARVVACRIVSISSAPAAGTAGQGSGWDVPPVPGALAGVAARSPGSALAVGGTYHPHERPLVARWNGAAWRTLSDPAQPVVGALTGVALFPGGAWAVGEQGMDYTGRVSFPLLMRVTGSTVREVPVPRTAYGGRLNAVAATSAADAWAVGNEDTIGYGTGAALILHWNGTAWTRVQLPATVAREVGVVTGVAATSATDVWIVSLPLAWPSGIVHWNGRRWGDVVTPLIGMRYDLLSVAATSARNVWAIGFGLSRDVAVILHWNGLKWTCALGVQMHPPKVSDVSLAAVSASSAGNAWAVGSYFDSAQRALALHWNGHTWKQVMTPSPGQNNELQGVAVIPHSAAGWAVGSTDDSGTLMLHWNGTTWQ
jgi:hypothetical protein